MSDDRIERLVDATEFQRHQLEAMPPDALDSLEETFLAVDDFTENVGALRTLSRRKNDAVDTSGEHTAHSTDDDTDDLTANVGALRVLSCRENDRER